MNGAKLAIGVLTVAACLSMAGEVVPGETRGGPQAERGEGRSAGVPPAPAGAPSEAGSLQMRLPAPTLYALFRHPDDRGTLHAEGEEVVQAGRSPDTFTTFVIDRIAADRLSLRRNSATAPQGIEKGRALPGPGGPVFVQSVLIEQLEYRYRTVAGPAKPGPSVVSLDGSRAVLEIEVSQRRVVADPLRKLAELGDFSPVKTPVDTLARIPVQRVGPTSYEVPAGYWRAIRWAAQQLEPTIRPSFFMKGGPGLAVASEMAEGGLNARGFTVSDPKLAARAGVEAGDVIRRINGQPVNSMDQAVQLAEQARGAPPPVIRVEVERRGQPVTLTYRLKK